MNGTTTSSPSRNLNGMMSESNIQNFVAKNKVAIFTAIVAIVAGVVGFGIMKMSADQSHSEYNAKIYTFESTVLATYIATPKAPEAAATLEKGVQGLFAEMGDYVGLLPLVLKSSDALMNNSQGKEARTLLAMGESLSKDPYATYLVLVRKAVVLENLGEDQLALETLKKMTSQKIQIFPGKTYVDLGRLYLKMGDKKNAKDSFTYVVEKAKDEPEFVKVAQLYLNKL